MKNLLLILFTLFPRLQETHRVTGSYEYTEYKFLWLGKIISFKVKSERQKKRDKRAR